MRLPKRWFSARNLCVSGMIAALYAALTLLFQAISFGPVQFRVSEALTLLPAMLPQAVPGLTVGCLIANLIGSGSVWDVAFGTLATLLAALGTYRLRRNPWLAALPPIVCNAVIIGVVLSLTLADALLLPTMATVALGEAVVVYALGVPMLSALKRAPSLRRLGENSR